MKVWFKCQVYLVPHIASDGPRMLPKLPLLKAGILGSKILTNPAKLSLEGRELMLVNYPLVKNIFSQALPINNSHQVSQKVLMEKVTNLLFSQGTISFGGDHYWPQNEYFNIHNETILVVTDSIDAMSFNKSGGKVGGLANTGNFERDGDFLCVMSANKSNIIQFCE